MALLGYLIEGIQVIVECRQEGECCNRKIYLAGNPAIQAAPGPEALRTLVTQGMPVTYSFNGQPKIVNKKYN